MCNAWCIDFADTALRYIVDDGEVLEVGSLDVNGTTRAVLSKTATRYIGVDITQGPGVDRILDVKDLVDAYGFETFDVVTSTEMLEHCEDWANALFQMASVLKIGGLLLITTRSPGFELHDYPSDYWRFSVEDFKEIFSPIGEILSLESDLTLGWPCGVGIIVRRTATSEALRLWVDRLKEKTVYSMATDYVSPPPSVIVFDQYSRYWACASLLKHVGCSEATTILDVGSGPECLLGSFVGDATVTFVDPLIEQGSGASRIQGDIFSADLDGKMFDYVTAVDVLEHVPLSSRSLFLDRVFSLCGKGVIIGFPAAEMPGAIETDDFVNSRYRAVFGCDYPWLAEHYEYGLPSVNQTEQYFKSRGWHTQCVRHGYVPWLKTLLAEVVCRWDIPELHDAVLSASRSFNDLLSQFDFTEPSYRTFVVASKMPQAEFARPPIDQEAWREASKQFQILLEQLKAESSDISLKVLKVSQKRIAEDAGKLHEISVWAEALIAENQQKDRQIQELNRRVENSSAEVPSALDSKHAELMKASDWAHGMMQNPSSRKTPVLIRVLHYARRLKVHIRSRLANSIVGDVVRHVRDSRRYRANMTSLDAIKSSLNECNGQLIITFPIITWDFRWQRPQHIVTRLRDRGHAILYLAISLTPLNRRFRSLREAGAALQFNNLAPNVNQIWLHSAGQVNVYSDPIAGDDLFNLVSSLQALLTEIKPQAIRYLIQFPGWWPVAQALKERFGGKVIFDCMDDHGGFSTNSVQALKTEQALIEQADLVVTSSTLLKSRCQLLNSNTIQIKNGTEFEHFTNPVRNGQLEAYAGRPIIGYYGAISDWFDMNIVAHCARSRPGWNFVLIGATFGADLKPVEGLKNVHFFGEKPYADLPGYLAYFDVCTIPFKLIPLTLATNPVKFYEYLSAGKPVVSIDLPELMQYAEDCYLARNANEFLNELDKALAERNDQAKIGRRILLARENSWDARVSRLVEAAAFKSPT